MNVSIDPHRPVVMLEKKDRFSAIADCGGSEKVVRSGRRDVRFLANN